MGLRIGETNALSIEDIDLKNNQIYIHKTVTEDRAEKPVIREQTKTEAGTRYLPIPNNILPYIKEQIEIAKHNKDNLLFLNRNGNIVREASSNSQLKARLINLGIYQKDMATHALRHTYATRNIEAGIEPIVLCKLMGHSDISVTLKTYVTIFDKVKIKSSKDISKYYEELDLFKNGKKTKNDEEEQESLENSQKLQQNIIEFPMRKIVGNSWYER